MTHEGNIILSNDLTWNEFEKSWGKSWADFTPRLPASIYGHPNPRQRQSWQTKPTTTSLEFLITDWNIYLAIMPCIYSLGFIELATFPSFFSLFSYTTGPYFIIFLSSWQPSLMMSSTMRHVCTWWSSPLCLKNNKQTKVKTHTLSHCKVQSRWFISRKCWKWWPGFKKFH